MSDQITYDDKADLIVDTTIDDMFKVSASDMNEIKNVVNSHADDIDVANNNINDLNNNKLDADAVLNQASTDTDKPYSADYLNDKLVSVGAEAPTDGERVWFAKGKNLFDKNTQLYKSGRYIDGSGQEGTSTEWSIFKTNLKPNTTYTLTNSGASGTPGYVLYNASGTRVGGSNYSTRSHITFTTTSDTSYMLESIVTDTSSTRYDLDIYQIEEGSTATSYEAYISPTINVDGEEWYNKLLAIKTKEYPSVTTSSNGYYNLNLKCNEVAIIGFTHDPIASSTRLQLYSNEQGWWFIRCSVNDGVYGERTITNLKIYYI